MVVSQFEIGQELTSSVALCLACGRGGHISRD